MRARQIVAMPRGFFITFEGSEGCGKSTQIQRLAARLGKLGQPVVLTREPGGTPIGEQIKHLLQFSKDGHAMKPQTELLLFTASRAQLVRELIEPALAAGSIVIADRFLDSTTVYQGVARNIEEPTVRFINDFAVGTCKPDITFVLDLDPAVARQRLLRRPRPLGEFDRMEQEPMAFYERVRAGYLKLAKSEEARIHVVDASQSVDAIEQAIWQQLEKKLDGIFKEHRV
jgi:dTMP kinase